MSTFDLTQENFSQTVEDGTVFIDFWAAWCGPCRQFSPIFEQVSNEHPDVKFAKLDTESQQALAASFNITSIPTLVVIKDSTIVFSQAGALPAKTLSSLVQQVKQLDMSTVENQPSQ